MINSNDQYRDTLFRSYFNEPTRLLSLCNAVLDTNYDDPSQLEINTLDGIFFGKMKNDISCSIDDKFLVLIEHQTSVNENMPFRFLVYVAELYNKIVKNKRKFYREAIQRLPAPKFFVLYDGNKDEPVKRVMKLSDAFGGDFSSLELCVTEFNINRAINPPLLDECPYLWNYSTLVGEIKDGQAAGLSLREAILRAIKICIANGVMKNFLLERFEEVFNMLNFEWNLDDALQVRFDEGFETGRLQGIETGRLQGLETGRLQGLETGRLQGLEIGRLQGLEQGENLRAEKIAVNMIRRGKSFDEISEDTDLSLERIRELAEKNLDAQGTVEK